MPDLIRRLSAAAAIASLIAAAVPAVVSAAGGSPSGPPEQTLMPEAIDRGAAPTGLPRPAESKPKIQQPLTPCASSWREVPAPDGTWTNLEAGMGAAGASDIWTVSNWQDQNTGDFQNVAQHWDGSGWRNVALPNSTFGTDNTFGDIDVISSNDAWAAGVATNSTVLNGYGTAFHWDGSAWTERYSGSVVQGTGFNQVSADATSDVWFGGWWPNLSSHIGYITHYNGSNWSSWTLDPGGPSMINSVVAISPTDVWAVGYYKPAATYRTFIAHWDGTTWTTTSVNNSIATNVLTHVTASGPSDVLAVGFTFDGSMYQPLGMHYDGSGWALTPMGALGGGNNALEGLTQTSSTDAWAVGYWRPSNSTPRQPLVEHWNGSVWAASAGAASGDSDSVFFTVAEAAPGDVWAGGYQIGHNLQRNLIENLSGLTAPSNVGAINDYPASDLNVNWTAPACDGGSPITAYRVTAFDNCGMVDQHTITGSPPATSATFGGLRSTDQFTFTVTAITAQGVSSGSAPSSIPVSPYSATGPTFDTACESAQEGLYNSDGSTWMPVSNYTALDRGTNVVVVPTVDSYLVLTANVDLWTAQAGYNQDIGIMVDSCSGACTPEQLVAWKESGGFAGTYSPNAAMVQAVIPAPAGPAYYATLVWKTNKRDQFGTIWAGAGSTAPYSPTRLTAQLIPQSAATVLTKTSTQQYRLTGSDGSTWQNLDATRLSLSVPVTNGQTAIATANSDLFTANAGYNQDVGIAVSGPGYPKFADEPEAWKESGGYAGSFSPNAAFVQSFEPIATTGTETFSVVWKANKRDPGSIYAGAGPIGGAYSPTTLTVLLLPTTSVGPFLVPEQDNQVDSDGFDWQRLEPIEPNLVVLNPSVDTDYEITGNADLWTAVAGYNQDLGIMISGGIYGDGTVVAWKESGGFAGTYSPNAAAVMTTIRFQGGSDYHLWLVWKTNRISDVYTQIFSGAGPDGAGFYSSLSLNAIPLD